MLANCVELYILNILYQSTQVLNSHQHSLATTTTVNQATQMMALAVFCTVLINSGMVSSVLLKAPAVQALHGLVSNYRAPHQKT